MMYLLPWIIIISSSMTEFSEQLMEARLKQTGSLSELLIHQQQQQQQQQNVNSQKQSSRSSLAMKTQLHNLMRDNSYYSLDSTDHQSKQYKCAKYCTCSVVRVLKEKLENGVNLTQAKCENSLFSDILTIDRRTQIIHISLPKVDELVVDEDDDLAEKKESVSSKTTTATTRQFRMPRLVQFSILREIVVKNLKFEVCDSEVFKRGQNLRRFQLNHNQLSRISKACFKHLDKLLELNLDYNKLTELESALFNSLLNLKSLSIAYNQLSELAAHQFANLTNLVSLNLIGNSFKTINLHLFEPMQNSLNVLLLAKNQVKSFVHTNTNANANTNTTSIKSPLFAGVIFKNLITLNIDANKLERIKSIQLHRFFNIKFLSIRQNNIATIRDKAFNGLKLIELNLAQNQLQTISKCSFCNATIKRLVLSRNNISIPIPASLLLDPLPAPVARPLISTGTLDLADQQQQAQVSEQTQLASSSQNMLILSQSIFGPLFGQLQYLDLSYNEFLADQLDLLLEPLLQLEYLNIANIGLERSLPAPNLFKNNRQLRYLNLSHNQLDLIVAETIEPLTSLEVLDLSYNKFSELDESFLVAADDLSSLKVVNFGWNPWFCSQCKVAPLYDWILRSSIYNSTCIAPSALSSTEKQPGEDEQPADDSNSSQTDVDARFTLAYTPKLRSKDYTNSLLLGDEDKSTPDSSLLDFESNSKDDDFESLQQSLGFASADENDKSILEAMNMIVRLSSTPITSIQFNPNDYCMKCEFPGELRTYNIHELSSSDFKFCAGAAPRSAASEPKIGLTLAIVIIGALFCVIIVVIVMYRKKSNTYYTNEEDTDHLNGRGKEQVFSVSSDAENHFADETDYSSPPVSQSFESYSNSQEEEEDEEEDEDEMLEEEDDEEFQEEEEFGEEEEEATGESFTQDSHSNARRIAEAERERRHQLAEYNKNELKLQSSQSVVSSNVEPDRGLEVKYLNEGIATVPKERPAAKKRQPSSNSNSHSPTVNETSLKSASKAASPEEVVLTPAKLENKTQAKTASSKLIQTPSVESQSLQRSLNSARLDSRGSLARRILSKGSQDNSLASSSTPPKVVQYQEPSPYSKQLHQQSSLQSGSSTKSRGRGAVKSAQTIDSVGAAHRSGPPSSTVFQRPTNLHLNRQRLAFSKEASQQNQRQAWQALPVREDAISANEAAAAARVETHSPTISDATTADSIALEALEYVASDELDDEPLGGALELSSSPEAEERGESKRPEVKSQYLEARGEHLPGPHSSHSALTQTGSNGELAE